MNTDESSCEPSGVTLVACYGKKPVEFATLIGACQQKLDTFFGSDFRRYDLEQVHATIVGLEGILDGKNVVNANYLSCGVAQRMDFEALLKFLRNELTRIQIRIAGFRPYCRYPFDSRGEHPYFRSFSIQGEIAVTMGWPVSALRYPAALQQVRRWPPPKLPSDAFPRTLDEFRRKLQQFGILHKYHKKSTDIDNDLFFVLGRLTRTSAAGAAIQEIEEVLRAYLAGLHPVSVMVEVDSLSVVGYCDSQLPLATSVCLPVADATLSADRLRDLYRP